MKITKIFAKTAIKVTEKSVNSACHFFIGQRALPKGSEKYKKMKKQ